MSSKTITKFDEFKFTNTLLVKGDYSKFTPQNKKLVKNSNLNFEKKIEGSGGELEYVLNITSLKDMFNGCENASFTYPLVLKNGNVKNVAHMFKDCFSAKLPRVDISESSIENAEGMFENCYNAILKGVTIPETASNIKYMFKNCKTAVFDSIGKLPKKADVCTHLFDGCESGVFGKLKFPEYTKKFDFSFMFYNCKKFNNSDTGFEDISEYIKNAEYMFFGCGESNCNSFDGKIIKIGNMNKNGCNSMFENSNFSFDGTYFVFYSYGSSHNIESINSVSSLSRMFYGTHFNNGLAPVIVLSDVGYATIDELETALTKRLKYSTNNSNTNNMVTDFTEVYANSNVGIVDLRGISNNIDISTNTNIRDKAVYNFSSMCEGCKNLKTVKGYLPPTAKSYKNMFKDCTSLEMDIGNMFKKLPDRIDENTDMENLEDSAERGRVFENYKMENISGMFSNCGNVFSTNDNFDLKSVLITLERNVRSKNLEFTEERYINAFPSMKIASVDPIEGLGFVDYDISTISRDRNIVKYDSLKKDEESAPQRSVEINTDNTDESSESVIENVGENDNTRVLVSSADLFSISSSTMLKLFPNGYYRYGGQFKNDPTKYFCIPYYPIKDIKTGKTTSLYAKEIDFDANRLPINFSTLYNTDTAKGYWNTVRYDKLYYADIYNTSDNSYYGSCYVGEYVRIYHENRGEGVITTTEYDSPVSMFI